MTVVHIIGWSVITAVVSWRIAWHRARETFDRVVAQARSETRQQLAEAERWRNETDRLSKEIEAWKAGHTEGRADVFSMMPMLLAKQHDGVSCGCTTTDQIRSSM
jgi:hypothetical protein